MGNALSADAPWTARLALTGVVQVVIMGGGMWCLSRLVHEDRSESVLSYSLAGRRVRLTHSEQALRDCVVRPEDIDATFESVGGLDEIKGVVRRSIVLPFLHPELYPADSLRGPPKGVLLYGPPGTGKTLLAKALAKDCGATFIEVRVESLFGKWLGQSEQAVAAIFSLGCKLEPAVIFVDELDSLLSMRDRGDAHAYANVKTIFLRHWDGFGTSERTHRVVVVGATNLPEVLDPAVLRRLPVKLRLGFPSESARADILRILLKGEVFVDRDVVTVASLTERFTGSDLKELCKQALLIASQRVLESGGPKAGVTLPPVDLDCFRAALRVVHASCDFQTDQLQQKQSDDDSLRTPRDCPLD